MAKLDEITAVLTEELEGFNNTVNKIEQLTKELNSSQLQTNIARIREEVSRLKQDQNDHFRNQRTTIVELVKKVNRAKLTPKWLLGLFCISLTITMVVLGYAIFQINNNELQSREYQKGKNDTMHHIQLFFKAHPGAAKDYKNWLSEETKYQIQK
ncbi:DUF6730 family protein [Flagellimonas algicola]|uniref:Mobilization protein n=1 Tax=Flagellimonas algicola TaxID=2583815 RepID=A0ABY2WJ17_9FLAO|nr:DUF6730 family protein [Allomuricauda algicola]TMU54821.1 hypothetical protein FGG15_11515 [Allomuricauda algicola]